MNKNSFAATSAPLSRLTEVAKSLLKLLGPTWGGPFKTYRPEDHYMRGPGPKWHEKHGSNRAADSFAPTSYASSGKRGF